MQLVYDRCFARLHAPVSILVHYSESAITHKERIRESLDNLIERLLRNPLPVFTLDLRIPISGILLLAVFRGGEHLAHEHVAACVEVHFEERDHEEGDEEDSHHDGAVELTRCMKRLGGMICAGVEMLPWHIPFC